MADEYEQKEACLTSRNKEYLNQGNQIPIDKKYIRWLAFCCTGDLPEYAKENAPNLSKNYKNADDTQESFEKDTNMIFKKLQEKSREENQILSYVKQCVLATPNRNDFVAFINKAIESFDEEYFEHYQSAEIELFISGYAYEYKLFFQENGTIRYNDLFEMIRT